jgi:hypothetical protein
MQLGFAFCISSKMKSQPFFPGKSRGAAEGGSGVLDRTAKDTKISVQSFQALVFSRHGFIARSATGALAWSWW